MPPRSRRSGSGGGCQVLRDDAPLLSEIGIGEVKITDAEGNERRYATSGGFVDVKKNQVVLLAETAERADEIDQERARSARDRASKRLAGHEGGLDPSRARNSLKRAVNRLRIAQKG